MDAHAWKALEAIIKAGHKTSTLDTICPELEPLKLKNTKIIIRDPLYCKWN